MHSGCLQFHNSPASVSTEAMSDIFDRGRQAETNTYTMIKIIYCTFFGHSLESFSCVGVVATAHLLSGCAVKYVSMREHAQSGH